MALATAQDAEILDRFEYHAPTQAQIDKMRETRDAVRAVVETVLRLVKPSADRTVAIRALHEANMAVNVAIMFAQE